MSPLPGGRKHCVIPYGTGVPVAVRIVANCYTSFTLPLPYLSPFHCYIHNTQTSAGRFSTNARAAHITDLSTGEADCILFYWNLKQIISSRKSKNKKLVQE